jgi:hypothetical protein
LPFFYIKKGSLFHQSSFISWQHLLLCMEHLWLTLMIRYFSQTERYHQEENKWPGPAISQRGGIVFLLTSHLFSTRYYFASVWQQSLKKCWQRLHRCFWFNSLSVRMVKLFCNRNMITYHSTNLCSPRMVDYCDLWECKENWK